MPFLQELCVVMHHLSGMDLHWPMSDPLQTFMEIMGWCPLIQPWPLPHNLLFLHICHLCLVAYLPMGNLNIVSLLSFFFFFKICHDMDAWKFWLHLLFRVSIWHGSILQWIHDDGRSKNSCWGQCRSSRSLKGSSSSRLWKETEVIKYKYEVNCCFDIKQQPYVIDYVLIYDWFVMDLLYISGIISIST